MKNNTYWIYNLPLQVWPRYKDPDNEKSEIVGWRILNYMPRRQSCTLVDLEEELQEQTEEEFFNTAASVLENLAGLFRKLAKKEKDFIYYPTDGMEGL